MTNNIKRIVSLIGTVLVWVIVIICAAFIVLTLMQKQSSDNLVNIFGYSPLAVQSNSMVGEKKENFKQGDMIFVKSLSENQINELKVDEIIVFRDMINGVRQLNTHRIVEVVDDEGYLAFVTKGDNNYTNDPVVREPRDIVAVYKGSKIPGGGKFLDFLNDKWGFFVFLVLPMALFFAWRVFKMIGAVKAYKNFDKEAAGEAGAQANADSIAKMLADANVDPEVIAATLAKVNKTETAEEPADIADDDNSDKLIPSLDESSN